MATRTNLRAVDIFVMIPGMQNTTATGGRNLLNRHNHELFITYYVLHSMAAVGKLKGLKPVATQTSDRLTPQMTGSLRDDTEEV